MSYILDALKKAERDRGINKVPALLAVHDLRPPGRNYKWPLAGVALLCVAAAAWFVLSVRNPVPSPPQRAAERDRTTAPAAPNLPAAVTPPAPAAPLPELKPDPKPPVARPRVEPVADASTNAPVTAPPPAAVAPAPQAAPAPLRDAIGAMKITVLVYAEGKAERLVFINGRKYAEGDMVDDRFLLESIRPDGAVLSHAGERAVLRPGPK